MTRARLPPYLGEEVFAAEIVTRLPLLALQFLLDNHLRRDAGVVGAWRDWTIYMKV